MTGKRDIRLYLDDILESIAQIQRSIKNVTKRKFFTDITLLDVIVHRIEIIGEAVKHIPSEITVKYPDVPWREIAGTRDKLTHHYFEVDTEQI